MAKDKSAKDIILQTYDYEKLSEITDLGCSAGVAEKHFSIKDTNSFFDEYEKEIINEIKTIGGLEYWDEQVERLKDYSPNYYKQDIVWTFIELLALSIVDEDDDDEEED